MFSLGCIYLEIVTVLALSSSAKPSAQSPLAQLDNYLSADGDESFMFYYSEKIERIQRWVKELGKKHIKSLRLRSEVIT